MVEQFKPELRIVAEIHVFADSSPTMRVARRCTTDFRGLRLIGEKRMVAASIRSAKKNLNRSHAGHRDGDISAVARE